jgi:hypothetical protein
MHGRFAQPPQDRPRAVTDDFGQISQCGVPLIIAPVETRRDAPIRVVALAGISVSIDRTLVYRQAYRADAFLFRR